MFVSALNQPSWPFWGLVCVVLLAQGGTYSFVADLNICVFPRKKTFKEKCLCNWNHFHHCKSALILKKLRKVSLWTRFGDGRERNKTREVLCWFCVSTCMYRSYNSGNSVKLFLYFRVQCIHVYSWALFFPKPVFSLIFLVHHRNAFIWLSRYPVVWKEVEINHLY